MANSKKVYGSLDTAPVTLFAQRSESDSLAYPIVATSSGALLISNGLNIPEYDFVDWSDINSIVFKIGGSSGTTVATLSISSSTLTLS